MFHFFLFLLHFDVICDLLLNRRSAPCSLFVKYLCRSFKISIAIYKKFPKHAETVEWLLLYLSIAKLFINLRVTLSDRNIFRRVEILFNARLKSTHRLIIPTDPGPRHCYACVGRDEATCKANDWYRQTCAASHYSLGTTHCFSAVVKYKNESGSVLDGLIRGCIQCAGKEKSLL